MRRTLVCAVLVATIGCPRDRGTTPVPVDREVDASTPQAKASASSAPLASTYGGAFHMEKSQYPTMEIWIEESVDGMATLTLDDDFNVIGCFVSRWRWHRSESHYSTKSGKDESSSDKRRTFVGANGRYTRGDDGRLDIHFDAVTKDACPPPIPLPLDQKYGAFDLHCVHIAKSDTIPMPLLGCVTGDADWPVRDQLVKLAGYGPKAMLLLADAKTGVDVRADFGRQMGLSSGPEPDPKVTFEPGVVKLDQKSWLKD